MASINVELAYALAQRQMLLRLSVPRGTTLRQAVLGCGLDRHFPDLDLANCALGIFGKVVADPEVYVLADGDRVELYRPLIADPKEVRKLRAAAARRKG